MDHPVGEGGEGLDAEGEVALAGALVNRRDYSHGVRSEVDAKAARELKQAWLQRYETGP